MSCGCLHTARPAMGSSPITVPLDPMTGAIGGVVVGVFTGGRLIRSALLGALVGLGASAFNEASRLGWIAARVQEGRIVYG